MRFLKPFIFLAIALCVFAASTEVSESQAVTSRVYVTGYRCAETTSQSAKNTPTVTLYDQSQYGDSVNPIGVKPRVVITHIEGDETDFHFDARPGSYDAFIRFPTDNAKTICGRNGPLVVIPGKDRHLFVAPFHGFTDWHFAGAVAGLLPMHGVYVEVLQYDRPRRCGDEVRSFDPKTYQPTVAPQVHSTELDDGAYYTNIHAYGKQDHTIALRLWGALFTNASILLTDTPETGPNKPPFIDKNVTPELLRAVMDRPFDDKLICVSGF